MLADRKDAGKKLALRVPKGIKVGQIYIFALARGGVIVAKEIAAELKSSVFYSLAVRKIPSQQNNEYALGAVLGDTVFLNDGKRDIKDLEEKDYLKKIITRKKREAEAKSALWGSIKTHKIPREGNLLVVDDGVATGSSVLCAYYYLTKGKGVFYPDSLKALSSLKRRIILVVPVIADEVYNLLARYFDMIIFLEKSPYFSSVGSFYSDFSQVSDREVFDAIEGYKHSLKLI